MTTEEEEKYRAYMPGYKPEEEEAKFEPAEPEPAPLAIEEPAPPEDPHGPQPIKAPKWMVTTALTLSAVFSPLLVPTYACAMALWITPLGLVPERVRFSVSLWIFLITAVIPMGVIIFMMRMGKVSDSAISNRKERGVPYVITALCYVAAAIYLHCVHAPFWLVAFYGAACLSTFIALAINYAWKISAHATTMGGLCAMAFFIAFRGYGIVWMLPWITAVLLLSGAVGSARILLGRHTPGQVYAGWLLGLAVVYGCMCL